MIIRTICKSDAEQFLNLCKQLDDETQFMLLEPGERKTTLEEQRIKLKSSSKNQSCGRTG